MPGLFVIFYHSQGTCQLICIWLRPTKDIFYDKKSPVAWAVIQPVVYQRMRTLILQSGFGVLELQVYRARAAWRGSRDRSQISCRLGSTQGSMTPAMKGFKSFKNYIFYLAPIVLIRGKCLFKKDPSEKYK